ncbi:hypothetical protein BGZ76_004985 [Entomortierella beljakovae]|nr:hypothetical protein BGZ76_004985 [Entomortierella beljakovae]
MERSFSHLLRTSRLATYDKTIPQIYTTTGKSKTIGDWGLKRNLPTVLRTHLLYIEKLDTAEHQTPFNSASSDYLFLQRWKENFPTSRPPKPHAVTTKKDLSTMTDAEFKKMLETAREKRQEWKDALAKGEVRSDEHLNFLNVSSARSKSGPNDSSSVTSKASVKVGPTYGFYEPPHPTIVQGRLLSRGRNIQYIGVSGAIASLSQYSQTHIPNASKSLQPYYVHKAELEDDGRPNVILGYSVPGRSNWKTDLGNQYNQSANRLTSSGSQPIDGRSRVVSRVEDILKARDKPSTRV